MYMIDSHAHIYLPEFDDGRDLIIKRAAEAGVEMILMPAIDSASHRALLETGQKFSQCKAMIGLHPCSVTTDYPKELAIVKEYLLQRRFIAIGEIGLDFYWDKTFTQQQYEAFHQQIELALQHQLPIVIHSRNATDECIQVVRQYPGLRGVFHCFSGTAEQAMAVLQTGFLLGIGGVVTFKNSGLDKVVEKVEMSRVILETDAPYLTPVPYRGKRNEPAYTRLVAEKLAQIFGCSLEEIGKITTENTKKLFGL